MVNPFMLNVSPHPYQLDKSISVFRVVGWHFSFLFKFLKKLLLANHGESDQILCPGFALFADIP